jgi:hypothetical protein
MNDELNRRVKELLDWIPDSDIEPYYTLSICEIIQLVESQEAELSRVKEKIKELEAKLVENERRFSEWLKQSPNVELAHAKAKSEARRRMLARLQFAGNHEYRDGCTFHYCRVCMGEEEHLLDCALAALIKEDA